MEERLDIVKSKPGGKVVKQDHLKSDDSRLNAMIYANVLEVLDKIERTLFDRLANLMKEAGKRYRNLDPERLAELLRDAAKNCDDTMESLLRAIIETQPRLAEHPTVAKAVSQTGRPPETPEHAERKGWLKFKNLSNAGDAAYATRNTIAGWLGRRKGKEKQPDRAFQEHENGPVYLNPSDVQCSKTALNYTQPTQ